MTTTYRCPICNQTVALHVAAKSVPYCQHTNTPQSGHRPHAMNPEETK